jgi:hypothetical protein
MKLSSIMIFLGCAWAFVALSYVVSGNAQAYTLNGIVKINPMYHTFMAIAGLLTAVIGVYLNKIGK